MPLKSFVVVGRKTLFDASKLALSAAPASSARAPAAKRHTARTALHVQETL